MGNIESVLIYWTIVNFFSSLPYKVVVNLMKQGQKGPPLHTLTVLQLGTETRIRNHDLTATAYLRKIIMKCLEFTGKVIIA